MFKILITDDHPIVRAGLKQILAEEPSLKIIGEASNGQEAINFLQHNKCDLVLLDISMPGWSGLNVIKEIKQISPHTMVLILSIHPEQQYAIEALKAGASGYITKETAPEKLIEAIKKVLSGGKYVSSNVVNLLTLEITKRNDKLPHEALSNREYQVMVLLASGKSVKEISKELFLSVKTISTYKARIFEKMGIKNNAQLVIYAIQNNLIF